MQAQPINFATAFAAGLVSFVSPCVLPLVPSYLSFLTGTSLEDLKTQEDAAARARVLSHALAFICGFTLVFILFGLSVSAIGGVFANNRDLIARIGGVVIIILGLNMIGVFRIPQLMMDKRFHVRPGKQSYWVSFLVGVGFSAGWSPCIGPILSGILLLASQNSIAGAAWLLFVYSMGLALPFIAIAFSISRSLALLDRFKRFVPAIETASGVILIATGIVLVFGLFTRVAGFFYQYVAPPSL